MIHLRLGGVQGPRQRWAGLLIIGLGIVFIISGLALLVIVGTAAAVIGAGVLLVRRLTGRALPSERSRAGRSPMELAPDFEILPASRSVPTDAAANPQHLPGPGARDS